MSSEGAMLPVDFGRSKSVPFSILHLASLKSCQTPAMRVGNWDSGAPLSYLLLPRRSVCPSLHASLNGECQTASVDDDQVSFKTRDHQHHIIPNLHLPDP
jgi:hypothetical protein